MTESPNNHLNTYQDFPGNPEMKPGYVLEFCDNFDGSMLDTTRWFPYYTPQWSSREQAAARYALTGNSLQLLIEQNQERWCPEFDGGIRVSSLQTGCFSGALGSKVGQHRFKDELRVREEQTGVRLYTPAYGYFETRLKAIPILGYMVAFWMIGYEESPEDSGEICVCEIFANEMKPGRATIGYGLHPQQDPRIEDMFYKHELDIDASTYHVYAMEWKPNEVDFFVDNQKLRTVRQAVDYPMQFMLSVYELPWLLKAGKADDAWPKVFEVDYVRGYRPAAGYT